MFHQHFNRIQFDFASGAYRKSFLLGAVFLKMGARAHLTKIRAGKVTKPRVRKWELLAGCDLLSLPLREAFGVLPRSQHWPSFRDDLVPFLFSLLNSSDVRALASCNRRLYDLGERFFLSSVLKSWPVQFHALKLWMEEGGGEEIGSARNVGKVCMLTI